MVKEGWFADAVEYVETDAGGEGGSAKGCSVVTGFDDFGDRGRDDDGTDRHSVREGFG